MRRFIENFITFILIFLIIIISGGTIFFALDIFGFIQVPEKYSLASLLYSQIEVIAAGENLIEDISEDDLEVKYKDENIIENVSTTEEVSAEDYKDPLEELERLQEEQNINNYQSSQTVNINNFYYVYKSEIKDSVMYIEVKTIFLLRKVPTDRLTFHVPINKKIK